MSRYFLPSIVLFFVFAAVIFLLQDFLKARNIVPEVLHGANVVLLLMSFFIGLLQRNSIRSKSPQAFFQAVMSGILVKMFGFVAVVLIYRMLAGNDFSTKSVVASLVLYAGYLIITAAQFSSLNKKIKP